MTFATVRAIGTKLPDVEVGTAYGVPALKLHGKLLACIASNKQAEPNTLVVRVGFDERDAMIVDDPETYYLKDHYVSYDVVLVRLAKVGKEAMQDLLHTAWQRVTAGSPSQRPQTIKSGLFATRSKRGRARRQ